MDGILMVNLEIFIWCYVVMEIVFEYVREEVFVLIEEKGRFLFNVDSIIHYIILLYGIIWRKRIKFY